MIGNTESDYLLFIDGKTYLACLAAYRLLYYTQAKRILFLVDRNNLARQTESEFSIFDRIENQQTMSNLYTINRLKKEDDVKSDIVISTKPTFRDRVQNYATLAGIKLLKVQEIKSRY